ncbi:MAG TPA: phosphotransferase [Chloroflexota bacterium]|nr:phosphotransferase [Chloroflexota bacterium]
MAQQHGGRSVAPGPAALAAELERSYGLAVGDLTPVHGGESARSYVTTGADGRRWFVKHTLPDPCYPRDPRRLDAALRLAARLRDRVSAAEVVAPASTLAGAPLVRLGGDRLCVFPFVEARPLGARSGWPDAVLAAVARAVGEMQKATAELGGLAPSAERFALGYEAALPRALDGLARLGAGARPGQHAAAELVLPRRGDVERLVGRHRELRQFARRRGGPTVLCHTDLNGDNLLVDGAGRVHVVDWDEPRLAPPEQDVRYLIDLRRLELALRAYEDAAGPTPLAAELFGFYYYRRVLVDLAYFLCRVLRPARSDAEDAHDLAIVRSDCFWAFDGGAERRIDELRRALAGRVA